MRKIPIVLNFERTKQIGHVVIDDEFTRRTDYVLAIGYRAESPEHERGRGEVLEFGLIPDSNYRAYLDDRNAFRWIRRPARQAIDSQENKTGLYPEEQSVMDKLMEALTAFQKLEREHPDEMREFVDGIHRCQDVLGMRVLRRSVPMGWPTYQCEKKEDANAASRSAEKHGGPADV